MRTLPTPSGEADELREGLARAPSIGLRFAAFGIAYAYRSERNIRIQAFFALLAGVFACLLPLGPHAIGLVALTSGAVLSAELLNTALEAAVDLASPSLHPLARIAKDAAAGAVLVLSLVSLLVGALLFLPPLLRLEFRPGGWAWASGLLGLGFTLHILLRRFPLAFDPARD